VARDIQNASRDTANVVREIEHSDPGRPVQVPREIGDGDPRHHGS
jgi:hypothetical protein